ncbi:hypothetical protein [Nocardiopsis lucentensis]|uniref:hypothetical protein n=1 Tax=Nocardiopsis lucentensis TaxID=53441 RepID=UPI00034B5215|nr:hypothetical protein [Nocardiopsis lucentensis]
MALMARDEIPELRQLRDEYDAARDKLMEAIGKHIDAGEKNARIARSVDWSREYIAKLRNARVHGEAPKAPRGEGR